MTIPEDVMASAKYAYDAAIADGFRSGSVAIIARAILAERQRCADIAKKVAEDAYGDTSAIGAAAMIRGRILSP